MKIPRSLLALLSVCALLTGELSAAASARGNVAPQAVDTYTLPQLGADWRQDNLYWTGPAHDEALRIGTSAFNRSCVRCHRLEIISSGIAPDPRRLDTDCMSLASAKQKEVCYGEVLQYFTTIVHHGRTRDDRIYTPPSEGMLAQETVQSIGTYLESRRAQEQQVSLPPLTTL